MRKIKFRLGNLAKNVFLVVLPVEFIPEHRENVAENVAHEEGNDNQAD